MASTERAPARGDDTDNGTEPESGEEAGRNERRLPVPISDEHGPVELFVNYRLARERDGSHALSMQVTRDDLDVDPETGRYPVQTMSITRAQGAQLLRDLPQAINDLGALRRLSGFYD